MARPSQAMSAMINYKASVAGGALSAASSRRRPYVLSASSLSYRAVRRRFHLNRRAEGTPPAFPNSDITGGPRRAGASRAPTVARPSAWAYPPSNRRSPPPR